MVDDYHFDGTFPSISAGDSFDCVTGVVAYSYGNSKFTQEILMILAVVDAYPMEM